MPLRPGTKCFMFAWVPAWAVAIFLSSALLAIGDLLALAEGCGLSCTLAVADAVSPQVKLAVGFAMGMLMFAARKARPHGFAMLALRDAAAGAAAMAIMLAILPEAWSRGFGVALFDARFSPWPTAIYLISGAVAGGVGTMLERSCRQRLMHAQADDS